MIQRKRNPKYYLDFHIFQNVPLSSLHQINGNYITTDIDGTRRAIITWKEWKFASGNLLPDQYKNGIFGYKAPTGFCDCFTSHEFCGYSETGKVTMFKHAVCDVLALSDIFGDDMQNAITALSTAIVTGFPRNKETSEFPGMVFAATWQNQKPIYLFDSICPTVKSSSDDYIEPSVRQFSKVARSTFSQLSNPEFSAFCGDFECLSDLGIKVPQMNLTELISSHIYEVLPEIKQLREEWNKQFRGRHLCYQ